MTLYLHTKTCRVHCGNKIPKQNNGSRVV